LQNPADWLLWPALALGIGASLFLGFMVCDAWALLPVAVFFALAVLLTPYYYVEVIEGPPDGQVPLLYAALAVYSAAFVGLGIGARALAEYMRARRP
jgi:hypothetical protein